MTALEEYERAQTLTLSQAISLMARMAEDLRSAKWIATRLNELESRRMGVEVE
jgi:hypothetical protein